MDYASTKPLGDQEKETVKSFVKNSLTNLMGECDDVFLEYVMVMILNGKTMGQISAELDAFIGEPACSTFALRFLHN